MRTVLKKIPILGNLLKKTGDIRRAIKDSFNSYNFYRRYKKILRANEVMAGSARNKRVFILATGPSIKSQNLSILKDEICISVSNFFVHPDFKTILPKYHVFAPSHDPIPDSQIVLWFADAEKHFPEGQEVFVALHDKFLVDGNNLFKKQKVRYYQIDYARKGKIEKIDFTKRIPAIQTVAHLATYLGLYLEPQELYLLGVDHDWILHIDKGRHFYEEEKSVLVQGIPQKSPVQKDLEDEFRNYLNLWHLYKNIRAYAASHGVSIKNATPGSLLDVFPRVNLETLFERK
ncbi:MAG: hypothetical protein V4467_01500 [Patescibacteria group bacterium]